VGNLYKLIKQHIMELSQEWFDIILLSQAIYILINGQLEKGLGKNRNSLLHSIGQAV